MSVQTLTRMPDQLPAGTTLKVQSSYPLYPADQGWVVTFYFAGSASFSQAATAVGASHLLTVAASATAAIATGLYRWQARAVNAGDVAIVETGEITVTPDFTAIGSAASDQRTMNEQILDALNLAFLGNASSVHLKYEIHTANGGRRTIEKMTHEQLLAAINRYTFLVSRERRQARQAQGLPASNLIRAEMP